MLGATLLWNLSNFAFNATGARVLGPSGYSQLAAVIALLYIASPALYAMQATASAASARLSSSGGAGDVRPAIRRLTLRAAGWTTLAVGIVALGSGQITDALRLGSPLPVLLLLLSMPLAAVVNVQRGALQGIGRFERYAASTTVEAAAKIALAAALLIAWPHVEGAVIATALALACALLVHRRLLGALPAAAPTGRVLGGAARDGALTLVCLALLAVLLSADVIAARHGMGAHAAGIYATVALAGKMVFYATAGLTWVLFPMLSARDQRGQDGRRLLLGAVGGVALVATIIAGVEWLFPSLVVLPLAGRKFEAAAPWLGIAACVFAPYAVAYALGMGLAARRCWPAAAVLAFAAAAQIAGFAILSPTIAHLLSVDAGAFAIAAVGLGLLCLRRTAR